MIENEFGGGKESNTNLIERLGLTVNDISTLSVETMIARDGTDGLLTNLSDFIELSNGCVSSKILLSSADYSLSCSLFISLNLAHIYAIHTCNHTSCMFPLFFHRYVAQSKIH